MQIFIPLHLSYDQTEYWQYYGDEKSWLVWATSSENTGQYVLQCPYYLNKLR